MASREDIVMELEDRGALTPDQQAIIAQLRQTGALMGRQDAQVRREHTMSSDDYDKANRARAEHGGAIRSQPTSFNLLTDQVVDPIGVQDEMVGAGRFIAEGAAPAVANAVKRGVNTLRGVPTDDIPSFSQSMEAGGRAYTEGAERVRAERRFARKKFGILPDIVGALATGGVSKAAPALANMGWKAGITRSAKIGAGSGAAAGFAQGEGGLTDRLVGGASGAASGAALGPVISHVVAPAAVGLFRAARQLPSAVNTLRGRITGDPDLILSRALERQGGIKAARDYLDAGEELSRYGKTQTDLPETLADTGPAARRLLRGIEGIPGEASTRAELFLNARQRGPSPTAPAAGQVPGQYDRVNDKLARGLKIGKADYHKTDAKLIAEQKTAADPLYKEFRTMKDADGAPVRVDVGETLRASEMADAELTHGQKAMMDKARKQFMDADVLRDMGNGMNDTPFLGKGAIAGTAPTTRLSTARFDNGKKALDDMIADEEAKGHRFNVSLLTGLKKELVGLADEASLRPALAKGRPVLDAKGQPVMESVYAKARDAHGTPAGIREALQRGRTFMTGDSEITGAMYKELSTAEKRAFRIGMARQSKKDLGQKPLGSDMVRYFDRPNMHEVLDEIMSTKEFRRFFGLNEREGKMLSSLRATQGSRTATTLEDIADFTWLHRQAESIKQNGGLGGYVVSKAADAVKAMTRMREADASATIEMLLETDRAKQRVILDRLQQKYGKTRAQQGINAGIKRLRSLQGGARRGVGLPIPSGVFSGQYQAIREDASASR